MMAQNKSAHVYQFDPKSMTVGATGNPVDTGGSDGDDESMSTPTREEFEARLETIEVKMDGRVASIEGKIDTLLATFNERDKATADRFGRIEAELSGIRTDTKNFKWWLVGLVIPTAVATVVAMASLNGTILSNMLASFESGKNTSAAQAQVMQQVKDTQALLDEVKKSVAPATTVPQK